MNVAALNMAATPHWLAIPPPPQVAGEVQVPQLSVPPQPSPVVPQLTPRAPQVVGTQSELLPPDTQPARSKSACASRSSCAEKPPEHSEGNCCRALLLVSTWKSE